MVFSASLINMRYFDVELCGKIFIYKGSLLSFMDESSEETDEEPISNFFGTVISVEKTPDGKFYQFVIEASNIHSLFDVTVENSKLSRESIKRTYETNSMYDLEGETVEVTPEGELEYTLIETSQDEYAGDSDDLSDSVSIQTKFFTGVFISLIVAIAIAFVLPNIGGLLILIILLVLVIDVAYLMVKYLVKFVVK